MRFNSLRDRCTTRVVRGGERDMGDFRHPALPAPPASPPSWPPFAPPLPLLPPLAPRSEWPFAANFPLTIASEGHFLASTDGRPFYYVADTHWPLLWHYTLREAREIAANRANLGFTAIQISIVPFGDVRNANGDRAFVDRATLTPNMHFFAHCDAVLDMLESMGFAVYIVALWWNQVMSTIRQGSTEPCESFGRFLGARWRHRRNLLWVVGGDTRWRNSDLPYFRALAEGLREANATQLISFHPQSEHSSSEHLFGESWLDFNSVQVHHDPENVALHAAADLELGRPVLVAETNYFWHHRCATVYETNFCIHGGERQVRQSHWAARLGGGSLGEGYGAWPFWTGVAPSHEWRSALSNQPVAQQIATTMQAILRRYPWHLLRPDNEGLVIRRSDSAEGESFAPAANTGEGIGYGQAVLVYFPHRVGTAVDIDLGWFANAVEVVWYSAVSGDAFESGILRNTPGTGAFHHFDSASIDFAADEDDLVLALRALPPPPLPPVPPVPPSSPPPLRSPTPPDAPLPSPEQPAPVILTAQPSASPSPEASSEELLRMHASWLRMAIAAGGAAVGLAIAILASRRGCCRPCRRRHKRLVDESVSQVEVALARL